VNDPLSASLIDLVESSVARVPRLGKKHDIAVLDFCTGDFDQMVSHLTHEVTRDRTPGIVRGVVIHQPTVIPNEYDESRTVNPELVATEMLVLNIYPLFRFSDDVVPYH
jgi:hypothetical protein